MALVMTTIGHSQSNRSRIIAIVTENGRQFSGIGVGVLFVFSPSGSGVGAWLFLERVYNVSYR